MNAGEVIVTCFAMACMTLILLGLGLIWAYNKAQHEDH